MMADVDPDEFPPHTLQDDNEVDIHGSFENRARTVPSRGQQHSTAQTFGSLPVSAMVWNSLHMGPAMMCTRGLVAFGPSGANTSGLFLENFP